MLTLVRAYGGPFDYARQAIIGDMERIETSFNQLEETLFGGGTQELQASSIQGDASVQPRYVTNLGTSNSPKWGLVDLANGVTGVASLSHLDSRVITKAQVAARIAVGL